MSRCASSQALGFNCYKIKQEVQSFEYQNQPKSALMVTETKTLQNKMFKSAFKIERRSIRPPSRTVIRTPPQRLQARRQKVDQAVAKAYPQECRRAQKEPVTLALNSMAK